MLTLKPSLSGYLLPQFTSINVFKSSQLAEEIDNLTTGLMDKRELFIAPVPRRKDEKAKLRSACVAVDPVLVKECSERSQGNCSRLLLSDLDVDHYWRQPKDNST
jgi:hypothetical protein